MKRYWWKVLTLQLFQKNTQAFFQDDRDCADADRGVAYRRTEWHVRGEINMSLTHPVVLAMFADDGRYPGFRGNTEPRE